MAPQCKQITPFVPCTDLGAQIAFYRDRLGFVLGFQADNYAFMRREQVAIRLVEVDSSIDLHTPERENSFYIDVEGLDALYAQLEPGLADLPEGRVRAPFDQAYGQREFHVIDEDCTLIFFGEPVG
ncbi:MAG: VOC family protein [Devosiaceae bacterium]|nr:VOC family protein [Devosiaceae bacterium MH13]